MANWRSTVYKELVRNPASPTDVFRPDGIAARRVYDIYSYSASLSGWQCRGQAAQDFLGYSILNGGGQPYLSRQIPHAYPYYNFYPILTNKLVPIEPQNYVWAMAVDSCEPIATNGGQQQYFIGNGDNTGSQQQGILQPVADYQLARMTFTYESVLYEIYTDAYMVAKGYVDSIGNPDEASLKRYVTKRVQPSAEYLTLSNANTTLKFVDGTANGTPIPFSAGRLIPKCDVVMTWHGIPENCVPFQPYNPNVSTPQAIDTTIGKVNLYDFPCKADNVTHYLNTPFFPAGTLLLLAANMIPVRNPFGMRIFNIEYHFSYIQPAAAINGVTPGHNWLLGYNAANNDYEFMEVTTTGVTVAPSATDKKHIYQSADFRPLFRVPFQI